MNDDQININENVWARADDFFKCVSGVVITDDTKENNYENDDPEIYAGVSEYYFEHTKAVKLGNDIFSVSILKSQDIEGKVYKETWTKNGELHRDGNYPAKIIRDHHYIPEETHLDESLELFYINGEYIKELDTTYEDIISGKPLATRQYFGYDLDELLE